jgi:chromosome segregation ATPase
LTDLENLLAGKSLKELKQSYQSEIKELFEQLNQTKDKLQFYTENLKTKESLISEYQQEIKEKDLSLTNLQTKQEQLSQIKEQIETELKRQLNLTQTKVTDLENQLLNLAKQKLANKKEAQNLVNQLQNQWQEKQTE